MAGELYYGSQTVSRNDFDENARRIAAYLKSRDVRADHIVGVLMRNDIAYLECVEACRYIGARYVTINWHAASKEVRYILEDCGAKVLVGHADLLGGVEGELPASIQRVSVQTPAPIRTAYGLPEAQSVVDATLLSDILKDTPPYEGEAEKLRGLFAYTSGSTGRPKGIKRSVDLNEPDKHQVYAMLARGFLDLKPGDRMHVAAPLYHSAPNAITQFVVAAGDVDLFVDAKFDPEDFLRCVEENRITHAYIVPTMMVRLLKLPEETRAKYDISSLRFTISTGSPCPPDVKRAMIDWFGPVLNESYGASEIGFITLISAEEAIKKPGSVGKIIFGGSVKVLDDNMNELPPNEVGALYIHLPIFGDFNYTNEDGALQEQRQGEFTTVGDIGYVDEDGYVYISDRKKDMIISGGANIFPSEIEAELIQMTEIQDCAVFGAPDDEFGEAVVAAVQCMAGRSVTLEQVCAFLEPRLAKYKMPRKMDLHSELPREDSGKIFKAKLRAPYWEKAGRTI